MTDRRTAPEPCIPRLPAFVNLFIVVMLLIPPSIIPAPQAPTSWDVGITLALDQIQVNSDQAVDAAGNITSMCIPGMGFTGGKGETKELSLILGGNLSGNCLSSLDTADWKSTVSGALTGIVNLQSGEISFSGSSEHISDMVQDANASHLELQLTYKGNAKFTPNSQHLPGEAVGTLEFSLHLKCGPCEKPFDKSYTGNVPITMEFYESASGPIIHLDRQEAARFSALLVTGGGFKPLVTVKFMFNGEEIYNIETLPNGSIPKDTWIWVPDDALFGDNQVWAEETGAQGKSNQISLKISPVSHDRLIANFDEVVRRYLAAIPRNERWYGKLKSGAFRNILNAGQTVGAAILWLPTAVLTLGHYQDQLWPDNKYVCSWYQAETLLFFNQLRFNLDPGQRALLDGLDDGPFNSGPADIPALSHFYTVVWPHAAALEPQTSNAIWETTGIAFDPWPKQAPEIYELKKGNAAWAADSAYASRWKTGSQYTYLNPRPEPVNFNYNKGDFPVTGGQYYNPKEKGTLGFDYRHWLGIGGEPPKMVSVHSPVNLEFEDSSGNKAGLDGKGDLYDDIPGTELLIAQKPEGGNEWYVVLPEGQFHVKISGTGPGTYQLVVKNAGQSLLEYPSIIASTGSIDGLDLDDNQAPQSLKTSKGQELLPKSKGLDQPNPTTGGRPAGILYIGIIAILCCAAIGILVILAGLLFWQRGKIRR